MNQYGLDMLDKHFEDQNEKQLYLLQLWEENKEDIEWDMNNGKTLQQSLIENWSWLFGNNPKFIPKEIQ